MAKSRVAVLRSAPESILGDIEQLCELAGVKGALQSGVPVILEPQVSWRYPLPGANTTPWQLEGTIAALHAAGYEKLSLVQSLRSARQTSPARDQNLLRPLSEKYNIPVLSNFKSRDMKWVEYRPRARLHVLHRIFERGITVPDYFFGKNAVHLPTVKCDAYTTTSGALMNAFGTLVNRRRYYARSWIHQMLVDLLAIQREIHAGLFSIMDGTTAGNGAGPHTLVPVTKDVLLASGDLVALDAVAAKLMGFDPMRIEYLRLAHEDGLGVGDPRDIELLGADVEQERWSFSVGSNAASKVGNALWFGRLKPLQKVLFRTRLVNMVALGSEAYRDQYLWRRSEQAMFEEWKRTTKWGQLFEAYALGQSERIVGGGFGSTQVG